MPRIIYTYNLHLNFALHLPSFQVLKDALGNQNKLSMNIMYLPIKCIICKTAIFTKCNLNSQCTQSCPTLFIDIYLHHSSTSVIAGSNYSYFEIHVYEVYGLYQSLQYFYFENSSIQARPSLNRCKRSKQLLIINQWDSLITRSHEYFRYEYNLLIILVY